MKKIIRISTAPNALNTFCEGILRDLSCTYDVIAVSSPGTELAEIAQREQVRTIAIPMRRRIAVFHDIISLLRLIRLFRQERPDMVHSITPKAGLLSMLAARIAGVPVRLHTFTGLIWPTQKGWRRQLLISMDKLLCASATHLNPEGQGVANDMQNAHITSKPLTLLGHGNVRGIDFNYYKQTSEIKDRAKLLRQRLHISPDAFLFVFIGRMVKDKGIGELLNAFQSISEQYPQAHLLLVGNEEPQLDPLTSNTQQQIHTLPRVHRLSFQTDVRPIYAAAQVMVFPSYREGMPNVVLEACAMSLPCIVTDINGSREIIIDKISGIIVPPHDSEELTQAMVTMIHSEQRCAMGEAALRNVQKHFDQPTVWKYLKNYYHQLLF